METWIPGGDGRRVQERRTRVDGWARARRARFGDFVAETCDISLSASRAEKSAKSAHALRRRDPEFAELCRAALRTGYERLEEKLLQQAGAAINDVRLGETDVSDAPFDAKLAMELLRH